MKACWKCVCKQATAREEQSVVVRVWITSVLRDCCKPFSEEISTKFKSLEAVVKICSPESLPNPSPSTQEGLTVPEG